MVNPSEEHIELLQAQLDLLREEQGTMNEIQRSLQGMTGVGKLLGSINSEVSKTFGEANKLHTKALGQGSSLSDQQTRFASSIKHLSGSTTGYSSALHTTFSMYSAGLRSNNKGLSTLAQFTKNTGGDVDALNNQMASALSGAKLSDRQTTRLAERTMELSQRFGISTNQLVGALKGFGKELGTFKALGLLDEATEAGMVLAAALGPEMASVGPELLAAFAGGQGMIKAEILGLGNERRAFLAGGTNSIKAGVELIVKAGTNATAQVERFTKGASDPAFALSLATQVLGKELVQAANARKQLDKKAIEEGFKTTKKYIESIQKRDKINKDWTRTMSALKKEIFGPLQWVVMNLTKAMIGLLNIPAVHALIKFLGQTSVILGTLLGGLVGVGVAIKGFIFGTTRLANTLTSALVTFRKVGFNTANLNASIRGLIATIRNQKITGSGARPAGFPTHLDGRDNDNGGTQQTANRQRGRHTKKLAGAAVALLGLSAIFGDQLPAWVNTGVNIAFGVTSLVAAVKMLGAGSALASAGGFLKGKAGGLMGKAGGLMGRMRGRGMGAAPAPLQVPSTAGLGRAARGLGPLTTMARGGGGFIFGFFSQISAGLAVLGPALAVFGGIMLTGAGAAGLASLVVALIGVGFAVKLAAPLFEMMGNMFKVLPAVLTSAFDAIGELSWGSILKLAVLGPILGVAIGSMVGPFTLLGYAMIPFGIAAALAAPAFIGLANVLTALSGLSAAQLISVGAALPAIGWGLAKMSVGSMFANGTGTIDKLKALAELAKPILDLADALQILSRIQDLGITTGVSLGASKPIAAAARNRRPLGTTTSPGVNGISPHHEALRGVNTEALMRVNIGQDSLSSENARIRIAQSERRITSQQEQGRGDSQFVKEEEQMLLALKSIEVILNNIETASHSGNAVRVKAAQNALEDHTRPNDLQRNGNVTRRGDI